MALQPGEPTRLPHWCTITGTSRPSRLIPPFSGADDVEEAVKLISEYVYQCGGKEDAQALLRVGPPGAISREPGTPEKVIDHVDPDGGLNEHQKDVIRREISRGGVARRVDLVFQLDPVGTD